MLKHRGWLVAGVLGAALLVPSAASALSVDNLTDAVTDPIKPVADDVVDGVNNAVEDATSKGPGKQISDTVDPVLDKVKGPVKGIVDDIVGPAKDVTDPVIDDEVIDDVTDGVLGGGGAAGRTPRPGKQQRHTTAGRSSKVTTPTADRRARGVVSDQANRGRESRDRLDTTPAPVKVRAAVARQPVRARPDTVAEAITDATRTFAFPLALAVLILLFLAIQHRIDARDPKLADGLDDEELSFA